MNDVFKEIVSTRHNPMIDPALHVWGWEIPLYLFLGGLTAGLLVLAPVLELIARQRPRSGAVRLSPLAAIVLLTAGMIALFLDLEYKRHVYRFYTVFMPASPMSWGSWILLLVYPLALMMGLGALDSRWRRRLFGADHGRVTRWSRRTLAFARAKRRPILWMSVIVGSALGMYTGILLGTLNARPLWNTVILGPLFLASGLSTGAAFLLLFKLEHAEHHQVRRWDMLAIGAEVTLIALMLIDLATGTAAARAAAHELLGGAWTGVFWSLVVVLGLLVPLAMELVESRRRLPPTVVAPALVLVGGLVLRIVLVAAGQATSFASFQ